MKFSQPSPPKTCFFLYFLFFGLPLVFAQIEVEATGPIFTPESLISNVFLGEGVDVQEITHDGTDNSVGYFTHGTTEIGIERGIVMSSGRAVSASMSNNSGSTTGETSGEGIHTYLDDFSDELVDISTYTIRFIPTADTLRFRYTFASEEYPEFTCSDFNDVFGFFIHGPGINGPYANNAENIALVPSTSDPSGLSFTNFPVTINNVNSGVVGDAGNPINCMPPNGTLNFGEYYNDNSNSPNLTYDGYLDVFFAQAIVTPCEEYTIVLAIADVGDQQFDSAVFLEARSFGTGSLQVETATVSLDGSLAEGCSDGELKFQLPNRAKSDTYFDYTIFGTATNGVDYQTIPGDLFIAEGDSSVSVPIIVYEDNLDEGPESIGIDVQRDPCNRDTFYFFIQDNRLIPIDLGASPHIICEGDSIQLNGSLDIPLPTPPAFSNETDYAIIDIFDNNPPPPGTQPTISPLTVFGVQPSILQPGVIKSICLNIDHRWDGDIDVFLKSPGGQFLELTTDNGGGGDDYFQTCFTPVATDTIDFGSQAPKEEAPFTGDWYPEGYFSDLYQGENPTNGEWQLLVKDDGMGWNGTLLDWSICFNPVYQLNYEWTPAEGLSCVDCPDPIAKPTTTTTYTLVASDTYGCSVEESITVEVLGAIEAPVVNCSATTNSVLFNWNNLNGATSYEVNVNGTGWQPANGNLEHLIDNLSINVMVSIEVRGVGNCPGFAGTFDCQTLDCTAPTIVTNSITNASCFGQTDGGFSVVANGNAPPYTYQVNANSNNTGIFTGLGAGDYNVILTDNLGCAGSETLTVESLSALTGTIEITDSVSCNGIADGRLAVVVGGGDYPYTFNWEDNHNDSISNLFAVGIHSVTVTDNAGCNAIFEIDLPEPASLNLSVTTSMVSCEGRVDGTATALPSGGTLPYDFMWEDGQTTATVTGLSAGMHVATLTDGNGCQQTITADVSENIPVTLNFTGIAPSCFDGTNGNITATPSGGTAPFTYLWETGQMNQIATDLSAGTYAITVSDANACSAIGSFSIAEPIDISINTIQSTNPSCATGTDGTLTLEVSNGNGGPYQYQWSDDATATDSIRMNLSAGNRTVTITDIVGCQQIMAFDLTDPTPITLMTTSVPVSCAGGNTGSVSVEASGGTGAYNYNWDINGTIVNSTNVNNLPQGSYSISVSDDNNCEVVETVSVFQSAGIDVIEDITNIACFDENTGAISLDISGGNDPYDLEWTDLLGNTLGTTENLNNLPAGIYQINITDNAGCIQTAAFEVTQNPALTIQLDQATDLNCFEANNGQIEITVTGGDSNYQFGWSDGIVTEDRNNLSANNYQLTVTDGSGCSTLFQQSITQPTPITISESITPSACADSGNGSITLTVSGGTTQNDYQYNWSTAGNTATIDNLVAGFYEVTVTDDLGCSTISNNLEIIGPDPIQLAFTVDPVACHGTATGIATVTASGGTGDFNYQWDADAYNQNMEVADSLAANIYFVTVTDTNGCSVFESVEVLEPLAIGTIADLTDVDCFGANSGSIVVEIDGGFAPFNYNWSGPNGFAANSPTIDQIPAGTYELTITDDNNCVYVETLNIDQPATGLTIAVTTTDTVCFGASNGLAEVIPNGGSGMNAFQWSFNDLNTSAVNTLPAGVHSVTVTDQSGCSATGNTTIAEDTEILIQLAQTGPLCHDGATGTAGITNISAGGINDDLNDYGLAWNTGSNDIVIANLSGGLDYQVVVTNQLGCTGEGSITIDNPDEIAAMVVDQTATSCATKKDGSATISAMGGTLPYSYRWGTNPDNQTTARAENLGAGVYSVEIMDDNGCTTSSSVTITAPSPLAVNFEISDLSCPGETDAQIAAQVTGGTGPYFYQWSTGVTTDIISSIQAGSYMLTITDTNGCMMVGNQVVEAPEVLNVETDYDSPSCYGTNDGRIYINAMGGNLPYTYSMDGVSYDGSPVRLRIAAGDYRIYVQDGKGCTTTALVTVDQPEPIIVDAGLDQQIILGDSIQLRAEFVNTMGATQLKWLAPYEGTLNCFPDTLLSCASPWSFATNTIEYMAIVTDEHGCSGSTTLKVEVLKARQIMVPTGFTPNGDGTNDQLLVHGVEGATVQSFRIYDRWGTLLFEASEFLTNDESIGWNGNFRNELMASGVYIWYVEASFIDGFVQSYSGNTTLLR